MRRLSAILLLLLIAGAVFLLVKGINALRRKAEDAPLPAPSTEAVLLTEIRDLLKQR
mgnify:CR=1 FL=1